MSAIRGRVYWERAIGAARASSRVKHRREAARRDLEPEPRLVTIGQRYHCSHDVSIYTITHDCHAAEMRRRRARGCPEW